MHRIILLCLLFALYAPATLFAQDGNFQTCYLNLCEDGGLTTLQVGGTDKIDVKSTVDGSSYGIVSFSMTFVLSGSKVECYCRDNTLTTRCIALRDKLGVGDEMAIEDVVFKDIKGGGKIRTAPDLNITIVKPDPEELD